MILKDIETFKEAAFPYKIEIHPDYRQMAGWYLSKQGIRRDKDFRRYSVKNEKSVQDSRPLRFTFRNDVYAFRSKDHAALFKIWLPEKPPKQSKQSLSPVILPLIRRVMPNIIANDIFGVQPMTGPMGMIFGQYAISQKRIIQKDLSIRNNIWIKAINDWLK